MLGRNPENVRYAIIRARQRLDEDAPYQQEFARVLRQVAAVCGELVGASRIDEPIPAGEGSGDQISIRRIVRKLTAWYHEQIERLPGLCM